MLELAIGLLGACALPIASSFALSVYGKRLRLEKDPRRMQVSVVVPTYNEEKIIRKKLENVFSCYPREMMEVLVVDCSTDRTPQIAKSFAKRGFPVRLLAEKERRGLARALNLAYSKARGDIVVKTDCDSLWEKNALWEAVADFSDGKIGAVTGAVCSQEENELEKNYRAFQKNLQAGESRLDSTVIFHGPFSAFRKSLIKPVDPESIADDTEEAMKIRMRGFRTVLDPAVVFFELSPVGDERLEQKSRRAHGLIKAFCQHASLLLNPKYGAYGLAVFPLNFYQIVLQPWMLASAVLLLAAEAALFSNPWAVGLLAVPLLLLPLPQFRSFIDLQAALAKGMISLVSSKKEFAWEKSTQTRNLAKLSKIAGKK